MDSGALPVVSHPPAVQRAGRSGSWTTGEEELAKARKDLCWRDGAAIGKGHPQPRLLEIYERAIAQGRKLVEGRPRNGFASNVQANDWLNFGISGSGGRRLCCRVIDVTSYDSF